MGMFFVAHLYGEILAMFLLMFTVAGHAWAEKARDPDKEYQCPVLTGFRAVYFIFATVLCLIFVDTFVKEVFFGVLGYGNIMHALGILVVLLVLAIQAIVGSAFVAPTRKGLITFASVLVTFIYLWEFYYPNSSTGLESAMIQGLMIPFVVGVVVQTTTSTIHKIYLAAKRGGRKDKRIWDIRKQYKTIFSLKFTVVLWLLVVLDLLLSFDGHGLLSWLSMEELIILLCAIGGTVVLYKIISTRRASKKLIADEWNRKHFALTDKLIREEEEITLPDGETLQGYIYRSELGPGGKDSDTPLPGPAILFLHGFGGFAQDVHFEPMLSSLAIGGYTVFAYDYRWSGHSRKDGQKGVFQGLKKEGANLFENIFADSTAALDWVLSHEDLVDPKRLAVIGFSYGGTIALSKQIYGDARVKVIIAGCAINDLGENIKKMILDGPFWLKILGKMLAMKIKRNTKDNLDTFLRRVSALSAAGSVAGQDSANVPDNKVRVFLTHTKNDSIVKYDLNFVKNKELFNLPDENCIVFETGDHEFKHNENALGAWVLMKLQKYL
ncbi:MAG: alpha/beta hydrolase family protein [Promethearchaeota archaeon]